MTACALSAACSGAVDDDAASATSAHTEGRFLRSASPYWWAASSYDEFNRASPVWMNEEPPPTLADDHPLAVRLQTWMDRIDSLVRRDVERETGQPLVAVRPVAKVVPSSRMFNAWVSPVAACLGAPYGSATAAAGTLAVLEPTTILKSPSAACVRPLGWNADGAVAFWNAGRPMCSLERKEGVVVDTDPACYKAFFEGTPAAADLSLLATSPFVHFSTDLLTALDEDALLNVAAHELSHYYRGHASERRTEPFWYDVAASVGRAPVPARDAAELEAAYEEVASPNRVRPLSFAGKYSGRTRPFLLSGLAPLLVARTEPDFACAEARDAVGDWTLEILGGAAPSQEARAAYDRFERQLASCASTIRLGGDEGSNALSAGAVLAAAARFRSGRHVAPTLRLGDTLSTFVDRFDAKARELDDKARRLVERARANGIGLYTAEQEADELAVELEVRLGLSPQRILSGWMSELRASDVVLAKTFSPEEIDEKRRDGELDASTCEGLLRNGFVRTDDSGRRIPIAMSLGDLVDPHHASCYRVFNVWRELGVHRYVAGQAPSPLEPSWSVLREEASRLSVGSR